MPPHKTPYDEGIYLRWHAIAFNDTGVDDATRFAMWQELYDSVFCDGQWNCNTDSVGLVTSIGVMLCLQHKQYSEAERLAKSFLTIPGGQGEIELALHWSKLGISVWHQGRKDEAIRHWCKLESCTNKRDHHIYSIHVWADLRSLLAAEEIENPPDPELRAFIIRFLGWFKNQKRNIKAVQVAETNEQLDERLMQLKPTIFRKSIAKNESA